MWYKKLAVLTLGLLLSFGVQAREWSDKDKLFFQSYVALTAIDAAQTYSAMRDPCECFREANPLLGSRASNSEILLVSAVSTWAMYEIIDNGHPDWAKWAMIGMRAGVVVNNHSVGVRIDFDL